MNLPQQPWQMHSKSGVWVSDAQGSVIARTYCDAATANKTYNEQFAQAENLAFLLVKAPELITLLDEIVREVRGFEKRTGIPQFSPWLNKATQFLKETHPNS